MKLENILVDDQYNVKITDFGFARQIDSLNNSQFHGGTKGYKCPELVSKKAIDGQSADVFALGVILFSMIFGHKPFAEASLHDKHYRYVAANKFD